MHHTTSHAKSRFRGLPQTREWRIAIIFCHHLAKLLQKIVASQKPQQPSFVSSSCKVVTKDRSIPDTSSTIVCHHLAKFIHPKRTFWKAEQPMWETTFPGNSNAGLDFSRVRAPDLVKKRWKMLRKRILKCWLVLPKSSFGEHEVFTSNVCKPKSCTHTLEKDFENAFEMLVQPSKIVVWGG